MNTITINTTIHKYTPLQLADMLKRLDACEDEVERVGEAPDLATALFETSDVSLHWLAWKCDIPGRQTAYMKSSRVKDMAWVEYKQVKLLAECCYERAWAENRRVEYNQAMGQARQEYERVYQMAELEFEQSLRDVTLEQWLEWIEAALLGIHHVTGISLLEMKN